MKRAIVALLGAIGAGSAVADWTPVAPDNGIYAAYADRATIRRNGALATMQGMYDFPRGDLTPEGRVFHSTTVDREYDCAGRKVRLIDYADHAGRLGEGVVVSIEKIPSRWEEIVDESLDLAYWNIACQKI